jgi:hypothetical protein
MNTTLLVVLGSVAARHYTNSERFNQELPESRSRD